MELLVIGGFLATSLSAFIPFHDQSAGSPQAGNVDMQDCLWKREPQVGVTLIVGGVVSAVIAGLLLFGEKLLGDRYSSVYVTSGTKLVLVFLAGLLLLLHVCAVLKPEWLMNKKSCDGNGSYAMPTADGKRGVPLFAVTPIIGYGWLVVALVICGGVGYVSWTKLQ